MEPLGSAIDDVGCPLLNDVPLPRWLVSCQIRLLLSDPDAWKSAAREQPLSIAPGLADVLSSSSPPSHDFFKTLPQPSRHNKQWAVYILLLERPDSKPNLYVGSGTNALDGVQARAQGYNSGNGPWSQHTQKALDEGYVVSSFGLLCWINLPPAEQVLRQRARVLVLEAVLAIHFNACRETIIDKLCIDDFYLWDRANVDWDPLCGHLSITEKVAANIDLSEAELILAAAARKERIRSKTRRYRKRKRDEDETAFKKQGLDQHQAWSANNPGRVNEIAAGVRKKAKDAGRFRCEPCGHNAATQFALDEHCKTIRHSEAVKHGRPVMKELTSAALNKRAQRAVALASKAYHCSTCDTPFQDQPAFNRYNNTPGHKTAVDAHVN